MPNLKSKLVISLCNIALLGRLDQKKGNKYITRKICAKSTQIMYYIANTDMLTFQNDNIFRSFVYSYIYTI